MAITVLDTASAMEEIFRSPLDERLRLLRQMLAPTLGMYRYLPGEADLVALLHMGDGFRVDREDERLLVDAYLAATGQRASQTLLASRDDVLRHPFDRAGR